MKKSLLWVLTLLINVPFCTAASTQQTIEAALSAHIQQKTPKAPQDSTLTTSRKQQIRLALQAVMQKHQLKNSVPISFDTFLNKSNQLQKTQQQAAHIQEQAQAAFDQAFFFKGQPRMLFQGLPDYAKDLQGKKYIFIGEASDHDQHALVQHTVHILKTIRAKNPQAKMLLANEFSLISDTHTWPIRFANIKNENITTFEGYDVLESVADRLNIDILALDDGCFEEDATGTFFSKIGPQWVSFNPKDSRIQNIASDFGMDSTDPNMTAVSFQYFLASNPYGVELRNRQWVSYLKAIESFYDIIVVYAGNAHVDISGDRDSVPLILNPLQAVTIYLYSTEELPAQLKEDYATREKIQNKFKNKTEDLQPIETFEDNLEEEDLSDDIDFTIDFSKPNYRRYDGKITTAWREKHIRNQSAFNTFKQQQFAFENLLGRKPLNFPQWLTFDVYLDGF